MSSEKADTEWKFARSKLWISYFKVFFPHKIHVMLMLMPMLMLGDAYGCWLTQFLGGGDGAAAIQHHPNSEGRPYQCHHHHHNHLNHHHHNHNHHHHHH